MDKAKLAKRYLLGDVSESRVAEIEDGFLAADDFYQELLIAEDDLIDAYVLGEMPAEERALFEQRRLTLPHRRERVEFARTLFDSVSARARAVPDGARGVPWWRSLAGISFVRRPALGLAFSAALLLIVVGGIFFWRDKRRTDQPPTQAKTTQPNPATPLESSTPFVAAGHQQPIHETANSNRIPPAESPKGTVPVIATFTLFTGAVRSEDGAGPLVLPAGTTVVRLRLTLEGEPHKHYRATLSTPEGGKVWGRDIRDSASVESTTVTLNIPAEVLKSGDYVIDLSGANALERWESVSDYSFRIVRQ